MRTAVGWQAVLSQMWCSAVGAVQEYTLASRFVLKTGGGDAGDGVVGVCWETLLGCVLAGADWPLAPPAA